MTTKPSVLKSGAKFGLVPVLTAIVLVCMIGFLFLLIAIFIYGVDAVMLTVNSIFDPIIGIVFENPDSMMYQFSKVLLIWTIIFFGIGCLYCIGKNRISEGNQ